MKIAFFRSEELRVIKGKSRRSYWKRNYRTTHSMLSCHFHFILGSFGGMPSRVVPSSLVRARTFTALNDAVVRGFGGSSADGPFTISGTPGKNRLIYCCESVALMDCGNQSAEKRVSWMNWDQ